MVPVMTWADTGSETINVAASTRIDIHRKDFMLTSLVGLGLSAYEANRPVGLTSIRTEQIAFQRRILSKWLFQKQLSS
jgi:hypothetical protein